MSMVAVAVGTGVAGIAGAAINAHAASSAAEQQANAAHEANQLQQNQYDQTRRDQLAARDQSRADLDPWRQAGSGALSQMGSQDFQRDFTANDFTKDPGYDFRMAEGQKALERSAAARGGLQSGGTMKALSRYGQDYASGEYQNAYNRFNQDRDRRFSRLSSISGQGQAAAAGQANASGNYASQMGQAGQNYATNVGNNTMGAANAAGAAGIAGANAWGSALSGAANAGMQGAVMANQNNWMKQWLSNQGSGMGTRMSGSPYGSAGGYV